MTQTLTLYTADYASVAVIRCSPPSWMARIALEEKGADYQLRPLSFAAGEHRTPQMLARNPRGTIPVLARGDLSVYETLAILEYIDSALPEPPLLPRDPDARGRALTALHESGYLKDAGMALFAYLMRTAEGERDRKLSRALGEAFERELAVWDGRLAGAWIAGDRFGLVDIVVYAYTATAIQLGLSLAPRYPQLASFCARMRRRPSVQHSWPETWAEPPADRPPWAG